VIGINEKKQHESKKKIEDDGSDREMTLAINIARVLISNC
jgi:hypothetical protein